MLQMLKSILQAFQYATASTQHALYLLHPFNDHVTYGRLGSLNIELSTCTELTRIVARCPVQKWDVVSHIQDRSSSVRWSAG